MFFDVFLQKFTICKDKIFLPTKKSVENIYNVRKSTAGRSKIAKLQAYNTTSVTISGVPGATHRKTQKHIPSSKTRRKYTLPEAL